MQNNFPIKYFFRSSAILYRQAIVQISEHNAIKIFEVYYSNLALQLNQVYNINFISKDISKLTFCVTSVVTSSSGQGDLSLMSQHCKHVTAQLGFRAQCVNLKSLQVRCIL